MLLGIVKRVWRMMLLPWGGFMELPFGLILFGNNSNTVINMGLFAQTPKKRGRNYQYDNYHCDLPVP